MTAEGMVVARRSAWVPHAILILGLVIVLFPVYVALIASSHELSAILQAPMTLVPGRRLFAPGRLLPGRHPPGCR